MILPRPMDYQTGPTTGSLPQQDRPIQEPLDQTLLDHLPTAARLWAEMLPWPERRYVLSLCHLMCAAPAEVRAEFLDNYTADGIIAKVLEDRITEQKVITHLRRFHLDTHLSRPRLRRYIQQFYQHSLQETQDDRYLESALRLTSHTEERNNLLSYILGFELLKMMFNMSWYQHEKFYRLQRNQEDFLHTYIKPIQRAHRDHHIIVPRDENVFFARRDFFVQPPHLSDPELTHLAIATFTTESTTTLGFTLIRHPNAIHFDPDYIFHHDPDTIF